MKKNILYALLLIVLFSSISSKAQQTLPLNLFSQNGWMTDTIGGGTPYVNDSAHCPGLKVGYNMPCYVNGQLYQRFGSVKASKARYIRFGGTSADQNKPELRQYLRFVDSVRAEGMEPILQISLNFEDASTDYDTIQAKTIINYINNTMARNVVYWSIGNEPDQPPPASYGYDTKEEAIKITNYIKNWSKAMRRAVPSIPIKIIGPELAEWNCDPFYTKKKLVDSLLIANQRCDITGFDPVTSKPWIDIFSFHFYGGINGDLASKPRATLIAKLRSTNGLAQTLDTLNVKLAAANSAHNRTGSAALISAITEANIDYQSISNDAFSDVKCNGFFAGQYWLEIASIAAEKGVNFVNFWSAAESSMGYMKSDGTKKSSYYHFKKAAENFSGTYYTASDQNSGSVAIKNIKAFGTKDANHIAIIISNQDSLSNIVTPPKRAYSIRLDGTYTGITDTNKITINMGIAKIYQDTIEAASTTMLEFDLNGNISQKYTYKQSSGSSSPGFQQNTCGLDKTYADQPALGNYVPSVYSNLIIGGTSAITIGSTNNHIYRAVNSITINGDFTVPLGESLELITTPCN